MNNVCVSIRDVCSLLCILGCACKIKIYVFYNGWSSVDMKKKRHFKKQKDKIDRINWTEINNEYFYEIEEEEVSKKIGFKGQIK
jgi:hypothetical protein